MEDKRACKALVSGFFLFIFLGGYSAPKNLIVLDSTLDISGIGRQIQFLEDTQGSLTILDIQKPRWQAMFKESKNEILNFPANSSHYWIKITLLSVSAKKWILFIDEAKLASLEMHYQSKDSIWHVHRNGVNVSLAEKVIPHNFQSFPLPEQTNEIIHIYLRVRPQALPVPIYIASLNYFIKFSARFNLLTGLVIGIILLISMNSLVLFLSSGDRLFLFYFFNSALFIVHITAFNGFAVFISGFLHERLSQFVTSVTFLSQAVVLLYGNKFLQVNRSFGRLYWLSIISIGCSTLFFLISLSLRRESDYILVVLVSANGILILSICLLLGVATWRSSSMIYKPVYIIYTCSYLLFLFLLLLELGHIYFGWPYVLFVRYIDMGFLCESVGLMAALGKQNTIARQQIELERNKAQAENIYLITERNHVLEEQVSLRTAELLNKSKIAEQFSEDLKKQSEELRNLNHFKDRLFSILSHDLRSPINQLMAILNLANKSELTGTELKNLLTQINKQLGSTAELMTNLLFWTRSQMSGFRASFSKLLLNGLIEKKIIFFYSLAEKKGIHLFNNVSPELVLFSDEDILNLAIHNLISNAVKFSNKGDSVTVFTKHTDTGLTIGISDTGIGMSENEVQNILSNTFQTRSGTANEKGTGLGLKICKDLIERVGAQLLIESRPNRGTTIYLHIPHQVSSGDIR